MPAIRHAAKTAAAASSRPVETPACIDKRERILAVAEDLFYRYGFAGTTVDMICAELGVTKPYVYYYFQDKHEIVETIAWRASVTCLSTMKFAADDKRPAHVKLAEGLRRWVAACIEHFRGSTLAFRVTASLRPEFRADLRRLANDFYADLGALMEEGRRQGKLSFDDTTVTVMSMGGVVGFMYTWYRPDGRLSPDELAKRLTATLFKMIGLRPSSALSASARTHPRRTLK